LISFFVKNEVITNNFYSDIFNVCGLTNFWEITNNFDGFFKKRIEFFAIDIGFISGIPIIENLLSVEMGFFLTILLA